MRAKLGTRVEQTVRSPQPPRAGEVYLSMKYEHKRQKKSHQRERVNVFVLASVKFQGGYDKIHLRLVSERKKRILLILRGDYFPHPTLLYFYSWKKTKLTSVLYLLTFNKR